MDVLPNQIFLFYNFKEKTKKKKWFGVIEDRINSTTKSKNLKFI